jgi:predicted transcriptional regulator
MLHLAEEEEEEMPELDANELLSELQLVFGSKSEAVASAASFAADGTLIMTTQSSTASSTTTTPVDGIAVPDTPEPGEKREEKKLFSVEDTKKAAGTRSIAAP